MKHIKTFENKKYKKYIVVEYDKDLFLSEIIELGTYGVFVKDLLYYSHKENKIKIENSHSDLELNFLDNLYFTSDNYNESYNYFISKAELMINTNKYNI